MQNSQALPNKDTLEVQKCNEEQGEKHKVHVERKLASDSAGEVFDVHQAFSASSTIFGRDYMYSASCVRKAKQKHSWPYADV